MKPASLVAALLLCAGSVQALAAQPLVASDWRGAKINVDVKDADVTDVFRMLEEVSGQEFVLDPLVTGTVTLDMRNAPWDQVLDSVLRQLDLGQAVDGGAIRILPLDRSRRSIPAAPSLAALGWMQGSWSATKDGVTTEEHWTAPAANLMVGMNRSVDGDGRSSFEYLRIEERPDGVVYVAAPRGREAGAFKLTEATGSSAVFADPTHDFPQRIIYRREGETLVARVEGTMNGRPESEEWRWTRTR